MSYLQELMKQLMDWIFVYTNNYGVAIILLTVLIKILLLPFNYMQINSVKKMQEIAPEQKKLQQKYKNNPDKLNEELMKLYKENNINPMGGCLPLLIQFPFIIALFRVFQTYDFGGAGFLWIKDLSLPDSNLHIANIGCSNDLLAGKIIYSFRTGQSKCHHEYRDASHDRLVCLEICIGSGIVLGCE